MFEISNGMQIALKFFSTVMPAKKPTAKKVSKENNKPLQATSKIICEETGHALYRN
jgi:hypothetical protein